MGFMDKLGSAAAAAKWKADQQMRAMRVQNSIHDLEKQITAHKASLADMTMELYTQGALADAGLTQTCAAIVQLQQQAAAQGESLRQIQAEQPPSEGQAAAPAPAPAPAAVVPPVPAAAPIMPPAQAEPVITAAPVVLVCPECGQVLKGKFCPEHGVAGVPQ